ncbi:MAG: accessory Sec system glycosylation chaperone GtfB [Roseburia sp.]|nr:accessory Sec system glycosylation chaperone GtfB [Roseburia sp.]MCM1099128.1 accessory Sec system glycosylation chaperone GtfB [Ruminococcus flavefaciens]
MGGNNQAEQIVLLFDYYGQGSRDLHTSFKQAGYEFPAVVIEDDGFLPEDVISVFGFFLGDFKNQEGISGKPRYFNQITVPEYWEISGSNINGKVSDLSRERGRIFYAEPAHKRLVNVVDWLDERGVVRVSDHYNRYGALYARTTFNAKGQKVNKSWFSATGLEIIVQNYVTGDIILNEGKEIRFFRTKTDFIVYFLKRAGFETARLFFNSLSTPFFVSNALGSGSEKRDVLFWQEPVWDEIPGNMQMILRGEAPRTARIIVQMERSYTRLLELGASKEMVQKLGFIYPFRRKNRRRKEALICTNSDRIEHCQEIVKAIPQMHFHIAALTEMSSKLMSMESFDNVSLYPGVKSGVLKELFAQCDYYLDINYEGEIVSAVRRAFLNNQLIFAFQETAHNRDYVDGGQIYPAGEADRLIRDLRETIENVPTLAERLQKQRAAALVEFPEDYRKVMEGENG